MTGPNVAVRGLTAFATLLAATALASCDDGAAPPLAEGLFLASLEAPAGHVNGAALIELTGSGIDTVTAAGGQTFMHREGDAVRVAIVMNDPGRVTFAVAMRRGTSRMPVAGILDVSDENDQLRRTVAGYSVRFRQ